MGWNLEQLQIFVEVVEGRSFSAVARSRRKAQSAISQAIALLEADLGVVLFDRSSGRQPRLTDAGAVLLEQARELLRQAERFDARASGLIRGEEARLRVAQDEAMPYQPVLDALDKLSHRHPLLEVQLASGAQGDVARKVLERRADLGLMFHHDAMPDALERQMLGSVEMVTVCAIDHPLARAHSVDRQALARHRQLVIAPSHNEYPGGEPLSPQLWRADSFYVMAELLMRGIGWAWLPRHVVQYQAYAGQMIELNCDWRPPALVVELVRRRDEPIGPAARYLAECFVHHLRAIG